MNSLVTGICTMMIAIVLTLASCKKENPGATRVPAPPGPPTTQQVSSVQLNGGNVNGRWTMTFEQQVMYLNDTFAQFDTTTFIPGEYIAQFTGNQLWIIDPIGPDTTFYTYSVSGNLLTVNDGVDEFPIRYGISGQGVMRWNSYSVFSSQNGIYEVYHDNLLERY